MRALTGRFSLIVLSFVVTACSGCGGGAEGGKPVFPASGSVTMFGAPLANATVAFAPTAPGQPTAIGRTDKAGNFTLTTYDFGDGAAEGRFKVVINKSVGANKAAEVQSGGDGHGDPAAYAASNSHNADADAGNADSAQMVPEQYSSSSTTPLTAEVTPSGENVFPLALE